MKNLSADSKMVWSFMVICIDNTCVSGHAYLFRIHDGATVFVVCVCVSVRERQRLHLISKSSVKGTPHHPAATISLEELHMYF